jgi:hypothetical protein
LVNDPFYEFIEKYDRCIIDYCLIKDDTPYQGYRSHKDAVLFAMLKVIERQIDTELKSEICDGAKAQEEPFPWNLDIGKAKAHPIDPAGFLQVPAIRRISRAGQRFYDCRMPDPMKGEQIPYWYAFLEPPHGSGYGPDEFRRVNAVLFPEGTDELEVYEWTTDWSNYFEDGHEWWGTACWSVYDKRMNRYIVIMAEATD